MKRGSFVAHRCLAAVLTAAAVGVVGCSRQTGENESAQRAGVILLRYNPGSESTEQRERGFLDALKKSHPQIEILSSDQYCGTTPESSLDKSQQMLLKYGDQVAGVFCVCEPNAMGMLKALEDEGLADQIKFVGFDPSPRMVEALAARKMAGIILQDPVRMGYLAVKTMVEHLDGKKVPKRIPTGEYTATPENMKSDSIARLLSPKQYSPAPEDNVEKPKYRIAVIPKGTTHEFWKSVHAGAAQAARELGGVEIIWKGPEQENDREGQISVMEGFITAHVDGICLAPLDARALVSVVRDARESKIPTVIFDSGLDDETITVSYVATDNYRGGTLAAERLAEVLQAGAANK